MRVRQQARGAPAAGDDVFETEISYTNFDANELPPAVRDKFAETAALVARRSQIRWAEHCSECAAPACFSSCVFYDPRPDMKCRRFRGGFFASELDGLAVGAVMRITFRRWGKLEGEGALNLLPTKAAVELERFDQRIGKVIADGPAPFGAKVYMARARQRWKAAAARRRAVGADAERPSTFVVEAYNPGGETVTATLTMLVPGNAAPGQFQHLLALEPGYNRVFIPYTSIAASFDPGDGFVTQIEPHEAQREVTLYFGLIDFAVVAHAEAETGRALEPSAPDDAALAAIEGAGAEGAQNGVAADRAQNGAGTHPSAAGSIAAAEAKAPDSGSKIKCVVWDLDNTLWQGTLIEDGIENLVLNEQAAAGVRELDRRGILNSIASKNSPEDAAAALDRFGMADYFLAPQVSWGPKSVAVAEIARRLNIGIDTLAFVDDQPFERAEVAARQPAVMAVDAAELSSLLDHARCNVPVTAESARRRELYRTEMQREAALEQASGDYLAFLRTCGMEIELGPVTPDLVGRVHELAQRTNQMNFSGNRYTIRHIEEIAYDPALDAFVVSARDMFGDYGIVGFAVVERENALMRDLMFSCRIQGKNVDHAVLTFLINRAVTGGHRVFRAVYRESERNRPAAEVFWSMGFTKAETDGVTHTLAYDTETTGLPNEDVVRVLAAEAG
jgi:FkbH-like protein